MSAQHDAEIAVLDEDLMGMLQQQDLLLARDQAEWSEGLFAQFQIGTPTNTDEPVESLSTSERIADRRRDQSEQLAVTGAALTNQAQQEQADYLEQMNLNDPERLSNLYSARQSQMYNNLSSFNSFGDGYSDAYASPLKPILGTGFLASNTTMSQDELLTNSELRLAGQGAVVAAGYLPTAISATWDGVSRAATSLFASVDTVTLNEVAIEIGTNVAELFFGDSGLTLAGVGSTVVAKGAGYLDAPSSLTRGGSGNIGDSIHLKSDLDLQSGHHLALEVLDGGVGNTFAGHGLLISKMDDGVMHVYSEEVLSAVTNAMKMNPDKWVVKGLLDDGILTIVPEGTTITLPRPGHKILDDTGQLMENGEWEKLGDLANQLPDFADDISGMTSWLPGSHIPNLTLMAPTSPRLTIYKNSISTFNDIKLDSLLKPHAGCVTWAACHEFPGL